MTGLVRSPAVAIVTSRLRRLVVPDEPWLMGLRGSIRKIHADGGQLLVAGGTAGSDFVRRSANRLGIPSAEVNIPICDEIVGEPPLCDQALIDAADVVYVLQLRPNGNVHRLLQERLDQPRGRIVLVDLPGLQPDVLKAELLQKGATVWRPTGDQCRPLPSETDVVSQEILNPISVVDGVYPIVPYSTPVNWDFLVHTTRACPGPWPDESQGQYVDSLLESRPEADHSTLSALRRIVTQKRLIGSNRTIRGGHPVVSFTACSLPNLPLLHCFRQHRVRWDFEPYGLCLRREWLADRGVRPVQYGDDAAWRSLSDAERPFFQRAMGDSGIDWTVEEEWRALGNLSLADVTPDDVILFVPDFEAAKSLMQVTSWPVTLWPGTGIHR